MNANGSSYETAINSIRNCMSKGRLQKALHKCDAALKNFPKDEPLLQHKGRCLLSLPEKYAEAHEFADELMQARPEWSEGFLLKALIWLVNGEPREATKPIARALEIDPGCLEAKLVRCKIFYATGEHAKALRELETLEKDRGLTQGQETFMRSAAILKSRILQVQGDATGARNTLRNACVMHGGDQIILKELRRYNPACTSSSKAYYMTVKGIVPTSRIPAFEPSTYSGHYDVIAGSKEEALHYIREIQDIADPSSLRITAVEELEVDLKRFHHGVVVNYFSMSCEVLEAAA